MAVDGVQAGHVSQDQRTEATRRVEGESEADEATSDRTPFQNSTTPFQNSTTHFQGCTTPFQDSTTPFKDPTHPLQIRIQPLQDTTQPFQNSTTPFLDRTQPFQEKKSFQTFPPKRLPGTRNSATTEAEKPQRHRLKPSRRTTCLSVAMCHKGSVPRQIPVAVPTATPPSAAPACKKGSGATHCCKVLKKYRSSRMRRVKRREYKKLRQMVPALQEKQKVSKVVVIEEAIKYIDELHSALVHRFKSRQIPTTFNGVRLDPGEVDGGNIRDLIRRLLANANPASLPPARIENVRTTPSFLQRLPRHHKKS